MLLAVVKPQSTAAGALFTRSNIDGQQSNGREPATDRPTAVNPSARRRLSIFLESLAADGGAGR